MKYGLILLICSLLSCNSELENRNIDGLWVIDPKSKYPDYMEFAIIRDSIYFNFPTASFRHELILDKDSISLFGQKIFFKRKDQKITTIYSDSPDEVIKVNFVRPSKQQLEIGLEARVWIYKVEKSDDYTDTEKKEAIKSMLDKAYNIFD